MTLDELWRQLRVAEWYLQSHEQEKALVVMRECLVSASLLANDETDRWLDYGRRKPHEDFLNALSERAKAGVATEPQKVVASLWDAIATRRNKFAHAGMSEDEVVASDEEVAVLLERCRTLLRGRALADVSRSDGACVLITPFGLSPGVLYSGVVHVKPDRLLIVTSSDAAPRIEEALAHAASVNTPRAVISLSDPHLGYCEIDQHLSEQIDRGSATTDRFVVNVTGGTTVMQYAVERLAARARRLGARTRRCALIDRRSPEDQRANPYVLGEIVWLDEDEARSSNGGAVGNAAKDD